MFSQVAAVLCVAAALAAIAQAQQQQQQPKVRPVPDAIQRLRSPLTAISLKDIFDNMNNPNTVTFYTNCVTGDGTCDRVGAALRHLLLDLKPGQELCFGCTSCERERVQYALDVMKEKFPKHACKVQTTLQKPLFGNHNPCV